ncbi:glucosamine-6-phosphate deaminase [Sporosarcina sp.]|uniref:glucosamine-6-phosphate deaminase n=1 Tax=Sporosarcina sp. TaxID=49982 RepID=UPI00261682E8|nr:glucosamine-6-phosphate deaminase [Sporosarcina sp.]
MKIITVKGYKELSETAAQIVLQKIEQDPEAVIGLATGSTPLGLYEELAVDHQLNGTSYQKITTFNLDEYVGLPADHDHSYRYYMNENLFTHLDIPKEQTHIPRGDAEDAAAEAKNYEELIQRTGGIDLQILGIGRNGHIGFNEPGTSFSSITHLADLTSSTREANKKFFDSVEEVPELAISMGIATIMRSKEILLLITGKQKQSAFEQLTKGEVDESFPASVLRNHPHVTVIIDEDAKT